MTADELSAILAELKTRLRALYGERLHEVLLYGSWARGEGTADSDIDVMLVGDFPGRRRTNGPNGST